MGNGRIISGDKSIHTVDPDGGRDDVAAEVEEDDIENGVLSTHSVLELATGVLSEVIGDVETRESILLEMTVIELDTESVLMVDSDRGVTKVAIFEFTEDTFEVTELVSDGVNEFSGGAVLEGATERFGLSLTSDPMKSSENISGSIGQIPEALKPLSTLEGVHAFIQALEANRGNILSVMCVCEFIKLKLFMI